MDKRVGEFYNVWHYGARGDGATDDTAAIQIALDAAKNSSGTKYQKQVFVPGGTYLITSALKIGTGVTLKLAPNATIKLTVAGQVALQNDSAGGGVYGANTDITVEGGSWDLNNLASQGRTVCAE
jgi:polygalacturonase